MKTFSAPLERFHKSRNTVSTGFKAVDAVFREDVVDGVGDGVPELIVSSGCERTQVRLQPGEDIFDRIEVRRIRGQEANFGSCRGDEFGHSVVLVGAEVVECCRADAVPRFMKSLHVRLGVARGLFQITRQAGLREFLAEPDNTRGINHQHLLLFRQIEALDVDEIPVGFDGLLKFGRDVNSVDAFVIGRRLLADVPLERRHLQIQSALCDERNESLRRTLAKRPPGHVVFADVIKDAGHFDFVSFGLKFADGTLNKGDKIGVKIS